MIARSAPLRTACAVALFAAFSVGSGPLVAPAQAGGTVGFIEGMGDVPMMPGLVPAGEVALVFDKPAGRIAESVYRGTAERKAIEAFYTETLPQLGWTNLGNGRFRRDGEELRLEFKGSAGLPRGQTAVRFVLLPH